MAIEVDNWHTPHLLCATLFSPINKVVDLSESCEDWEWVRGNLGVLNYLGNSPLGDGESLMRNLRQLLLCTSGVLDKLIKRRERTVAPQSNV